MTPIYLHPSTPQLTALPPLSLYIHIPWCIRKCPYCDFNSHSSRTPPDEMAYVEALLQDLHSELPHVWGRPIETIFIGGGTPSLFHPQSINHLLSGVRALLRVNPDAEITLEANPSTFEFERFQGFKEAGINRLSIGVQSFDNAHLTTLGRVHQADEARRAIDTAVRLFERVNVDLMYALPHQTVQQARNDVRQAAALGVSHISAYHLTMEPNTAFGHQPPQGLPDDDSAYQIEDAVHDELHQLGFVRYETSAFAQTPPHQARHNLNYWQFGDYIGIGAGAHGKISHHNRIERTLRRRHPKDYLHAIAQHHAPERRNINMADLPFEFMMNALRLIDGVPSAYLTERTGIYPHRLAQQIRDAQQQGLLCDDPSRFQATALGQRFLNNLLGCFLA